MVHEDPSTDATQKLPEERMFRKKSDTNAGAGFSSPLCVSWPMHGFYCSRIFTTAVGKSLWIRRKLWKWLCLR
ncbi:MAG: hypothetical protein LBJ16_00995 [Holosporaceae bacterium]|nr:hypothetical protein [Holosporaceae bacterium]